jgi:hypothetical protein
MTGQGKGIRYTQAIATPVSPATPRRVVLLWHLQIPATCKLVSIASGQAIPRRDLR